MKRTSDLEDLIAWFRRSPFSIIVVYIVAIISAIATLVRKDDFIYIPSGSFYQYTVYIVPVLIILIIVYLQKKPYLNYNKNGDRTWIYKQPLWFRKIVRLFINIFQVSFVSIIIYYSIGVFASFFPQDYSRFAYSTEVSWKDEISRKGHRKYRVGTDYTDTLIPDQYKLIYLIVTGLNRNYFYTKSKTHKDMYVGKEVTILSKNSSLWGEYLYDIDYTKRNLHYKDSSNTYKSKKKQPIKNKKEHHQEIKEKMLKHKKDFENMIYQKDTNKSEVAEPTRTTYPKLIQFQEM